MPELVRRPLAVRYLHGDAKSADGSRFMTEYVPVAARLNDELARREFVLDALLTFLIRLRYFLSPLQLQYKLRKRLGLLDLRHRWFGGRFAKQ